MLGGLHKRGGNFVTFLRSRERRCDASQPEILDVCRSDCNNRCSESTHLPNNNTLCFQRRFVLSTERKFGPTVFQIDHFQKFGKNTGKQLKHMYISNVNRNIMFFFLTEVKEIRLPKLCSLNGLNNIERVIHFKTSENRMKIGACVLTKYVFVYGKFMTLMEGSFLNCFNVFLSLSL